MSKLENSKVGDEVAVYRGGIHYSDPVKAIITRTTATIIEVGKSRFLRRTGYEHGGASSSKGFIEPWTSDVERWIAERKATAELAVRRKSVMQRRDEVFRPMDSMPHPRYEGQDIARPLSNSDLDAVEAMIAEVTAIVTRTVASFGKAEQ